MTCSSSSSPATESSPSGMRRAARPPSDARGRSPASLSWGQSAAVWRAKAVGLGHTDPPTPDFSGPGRTPGLSPARQGPKEPPWGGKRYFGRGKRLIWHPALLVSPLQAPTCGH